MSSVELSWIRFGRSVQQLEQAPAFHLCVTFHDVRVYKNKTNWRYPLTLSYSSQTSKTYRGLKGSVARLLRRDMMANSPHRNDVEVEVDDEKPEDYQNEFTPGDKAGYGSALTDDAHTRALTRKLLWKLDIRYVDSPLYMISRILNSLSAESGSFRSWPSSFCAPSLTARMLETPKSLGWRKMSVSPTASTPMGWQFSSHST